MVKLFDKCQKYKIQVVFNSKTIKKTIKARGKDFFIPNDRFIPKTNVSLQPCSLPVCRSSALATEDAVRLIGCKVMYIGARRMARPMPRGRPLEPVGDNRIR